MISKAIRADLEALGWLYITCPNLLKIHNPSIERYELWSISGQQRWNGSLGSILITTYDC
jgi:hypothetical protein